jgi:hypothetical protein
MLEQWGNLEVEVAQRALECMADAEATRVEISRVLLNPLREKLPKNSSEGRSPIPASASRRFTLSDVDMMSSVDDRGSFRASAFPTPLRLYKCERFTVVRSGGKSHDTDDLRGNTARDHR